MVLLIGNYPPDQQQSMQRFATMMLQGLTDAGVAVEMIRPEPRLGNFRSAGTFVAKWLAYIDKHLFFPARLRRKLAAPPDVVHICDHSNAVYASQCRNVPVVVTCHDFLAIRGGLGEETDTPASSTGKLLQRWILRGLSGADMLACISKATADDAQRLLGAGRPAIEIVHLGLNYPYRKLEPSAACARLEKIDGFDIDLPYVLHVGSNLRRKNREAILRIFARVREQWNGRLVFAGDPLSPSLLSQARELGILDRVLQISHPDNEALEALYTCAMALLYPSRFEGFGWPVIEAQACGCPVLCSNAGPLPEAAGDAGLLHDVYDEEGFADDLLSLTNAAEREKWSEKSLRNAERFSTAKMIARYIDIYKKLGARI